MIDPRLYGKQPDGGWVLDQDHDITKWDWTRPPEHSEKFYSEDQPRDERGRWTNADGGGRSISQPTLSPRATRALKSHKPMTKEKEEIATAMEWKITALLRGEHTDDDLPPDVTLTINGQFHGLDVKTNIDGKHDKVTVHPDSRIRKEEWAKEHKARFHIVAVDIRHGRHDIYYGSGAHSFRYGAMVRVRNIAHLRRLIASGGE